MLLALTLSVGCAGRSGGSGGAQQGLALVIREHAPSGEGAVLWHRPVEVGDRIGFHWIHSVEHFPWSDFLVVLEDGRLDLVESRFGGFGAGIPHDDPGMRVEDGMVVTEPDRPPMDYYSWINSHSALQNISLNGETLISGIDLPHHEAMILTAARTERR